MHGEHTLAAMSSDPTWGCEGGPARGWVPQHPTAEVAAAAGHLQVACAPLGVGTLQAEGAGGGAPQGASHPTPPRGGSRQPRPTRCR